MRGLNPSRAPAHKELRAVFGVVLLAALPLFIGLVVVATKFTGLTDPVALDHAQLARHVAAFDGFVTDVLRPLSLTIASQTESLPHPDLYNAPVHPALLAAVYAMVGATDRATAGLGVALWVLSVWLTYVVARTWFSARAAVLGTIFYCGGVAALLAAAGGLPSPVLAVGLLVVWWAIFPKAGHDEAANTGVAWWRIAAAGIVCGLLVLTDYSFWILAVVVAVYVARVQERKGWAVGLFVASGSIVLLPWVWRDVSLSGSPWFGLCWYEPLTGTREFPGETLWRTFAEPPNPILYLVTHPFELMRKAAFGLTQYRSSVTGLVDPVVGFVFVGALFGRSLRRWRVQLAVIIVSLVLVVLGTCIWRAEPRLLFAWSPVMAIFAAAQLARWTQENVGRIPLNFRPWRPQPPDSVKRELPGKLGRALVYVSVVGLTSFSLVVFLVGSRGRGESRARLALELLAQRIPAKHVVATDQPAVVAWYMQRPALWLWQEEKAWPHLQRIVGDLGGIYFSPAASSMSPPEWGNWWSWIASPRGRYQGLTPVANIPLAGVVRLPQMTTSAPPNAVNELLTRVNEVAATPDSATAHLELARAYFQLDRLREADAEFQAALRLDPQSVEALVGRWQLMTRLNGSPEVLAMSQAAVQLNAQDSKARAQLERVAEYFDNSLTQYPADPWLLLQAALCQGKLKQWEQAQRYYARIAQLVPGAIAPRLLLASLYFQQGAFEEATTECERLVKEQPKIATVHVLLGDIHFAQARYAEALLEYEKVERLQPERVAGYQWAGRTYLQLKRYDEAVQHFEKALALSPSSIVVRFDLAQAWLVQNKVAEAVAVYEGLQRDYPKNIVVLNNLAELCGRNGQVPRGLELIRQAVQLAPTNAGVRDTAGWLNYLAGNREEALQHLREAVRLAPRQGISHYRLGRVFQAQGRAEEARECFKRALETNLSEVQKQEVEKVLAGR